MKKLFVLLLTLALAAGLMACGGNDAGTADSNGDGETAGEAAQDPVADGIEEGAELIFWSMWSEVEPQALAIGRAAEAFTEATGVPVHINFNGRQGQREGLAPALAAGETIDIFDEDIDRVIGQWGEHLLPLDDFVNDSFSDTDGQIYKDLLNPTAIELVRARGDGSYLVVPYQPFIFTTQFNKDLFEEAGIDSVPATWDEFLDVCQALVDAGITPLTVDNAYMPANFGMILVRIAGSERTLEIFDNQEFDDPAVLRAAEVLEELITRGFISPMAATNVFPEGQAGEFAMETVAMNLNGTWLPNELRELNPDLNWGSFPWPAIDAGGSGTEANNASSQSLGIHVNTEYPNAAFAFLRWLTLGYWDQYIADATWGVPVAAAAVWPEQLADARVAFEGTTDVLTWAAGAENDPNVTAAIIEGFQRMVAGTIDAQEFVDSLIALN